ncbi:hypothetical protein BH09VER1_BH09VER1_13400 [soil metagenome]
MAVSELYAVELEGVSQEFAFDLLSDDERQRAAAFHFERDRRRWVAARGALRTLIGRATGTAARKVVFAQEARGRPYVKGGPDFNLSHAEGMALIGICREGRVGVDIERKTRGREIGGMREMFCSEEEMRREMTAEELIGIWCAKEAYLKARGTGLDDSLRTLTIGAELGGWRVHFPPGLEEVGYCAAVALPEGVECPAIGWV